jgi:hypothetical protein
LGRLSCDTHSQTPRNILRVKSAELFERITLAVYLNPRVCEQLFEALNPETLGLDLFVAGHSPIKGCVVKRFMAKHNRSHWSDPR